MNHSEFHINAPFRQVATLLVIATTVIAIGCSANPEAVDRGEMQETDLESMNATVLQEFGSRSSSKVAGPASQELTDAASALYPRAMVKNAVFHFGTMHAYEVRKHTFLVRNDGQAPLELEEDVSNCKCTVASLPDQPIPPGEQGEIELEWTVRPSAEQFRQTAEFVTNDPQNRRLGLTIVGEVLGELYVDPPYFSAERLRPDETAELEAVVSSPVWDDFKIADVKPSLEGMDCQLSVASGAQLATQHGKAGWVLRVVLPKGLPHGRFRHSVALCVQPPGEPQELRRLEIPVIGNVLRRVAVYGKGIDSEGVVRFGVVEARRKHRLRFLVKVHDETPQLIVKRKEVDPQFLQVDLQPFRGQQGAANLYHLDVVLPPDAPACVHTGETRGAIKLYFDHPRIETLELGTELIVRPSRADGLAQASVR